jgi:hypothetical protein
MTEAKLADVFMIDADGEVRARRDPMEIIREQEFNGFTPRVNSIIEYIDRCNQRRIRPTSKGWAKQVFNQDDEGPGAA